MKIGAFAFSVGIAICSAQAASSRPKDRLDFGSPKLGASRTLLPRGLSKERNCYESPRGDDCEYRSRENVYYVVFGKIITRKEIRLPSKANLPFGVLASDSPSSVRKKVESSLGLRLSNSIDGGDLFLSVTTTESQIDKELYFRFHERKLIRIGVTAGDLGE